MSCHILQTGKLRLRGEAEHKLDHVYTTTKCQRRDLNPSFLTPSPITIPPWWLSLLKQLSYWSKYRLYSPTPKSSLSKTWMGLIVNMMCIHTSVYFVFIYIHRYTYVYVHTYIWRYVNISVYYMKYIKIYIFFFQRHLILGVMANIQTHILHPCDVNILTIYFQILASSSER